MNTTDKNEDDKNERSSAADDALPPKDGNKQPFDINGPAGTDEKSSRKIAANDGLSAEELEQQPFNINDSDEE
jgi:hypothetical protein